MPSYLGDSTFVEAISRGWGLAIRCSACKVEKRWSDKQLADRFIDRLDGQVVSIAPKLKCTEPGCAGGDTILSFYNAGAFEGAVSETVSAIEARAQKLRDMAEDAARGPTSYAGMKMRG